MAQHVLDDLHVDPGGQGEGGGTVAEVVEPDWGQPGLLRQGREVVSHVRRVVGAAVGLGEHQSGLHPVAAGGLFLGLAPPQMLGEHERGVRATLASELSVFGVDMAISHPYCTI